ncbi:hypothetical protein VTN49DRAFT_835 [Thermomyces lanuginosus]|uniref:uncharacterized protein n=1 Tax=Thermomyces lanuginosus TaxID=5541 RepID=UPI003742BB15
MNPPPTPVGRTAEPDHRRGSSDSDVSVSSSRPRAPPTASSDASSSSNAAQRNNATLSPSSIRPSGSPRRAAAAAAAHGDANVHNSPNVHSSPRIASESSARHRARHHSQGFFEPFLPTTGLPDHGSAVGAAAMAALTASQIAAQAAMQSQQQQQSSRHRSQASDDSTHRSRKGSTQDSPPSLQQPAAERVYQNGLVGGNTQAATTAANLVFPKSSTPSSDQSDHHQHKQKSEKEKSKKKLFSKPKHVGISRDKDSSGKDKDKAIPSPSKLGFGTSSGLSRIVSASTTNLTDSSNSSMYNLSNASATTVVPADRSEKDKDKDKEKEKEKDKEKHKHHFLSRQKLKLKDDHYNLPLSSASSNSKPLDPNAPQSLYSFTPSSPAPSASPFAKSVSGLDLLHGGRALREKKREEKALAAGLDFGRELDGTDPTAGGQPSSLGSCGGSVLHGGDAAIKETLQGFGLNNMTAEDVWDFLKAKLLVVFDGGDVRYAVEDLNKLVVIHIQRCFQKRVASVVVEDLRDLLRTGFSSLSHSLSGVPDEKLAPHLVQIWMLVFGTVLPFMQAVFLPLDLEFKGRGSIMTAREAREFWGGIPNCDSPDASAGDALDVRTIVLVEFRDSVILPRYDSLKAIFSRLSLENINASVNALNASHSGSSAGRPGTAASLDPTHGSFNSQSSLNNASATVAGSYSSDSTSAATRSRATSNTSSNTDQLFFQSVASPSQRAHYQANLADSSHVVTDTVGRMLQCFSVLASVQSGDEAQERIETLNKALKHNWLGRGRTGRDRRGFVGTKIRPPTMTPATKRNSSSTATTTSDDATSTEKRWSGRSSSDEGSMS